MATTNLISKTLGDVLIQSGNGTPDHIAPKGSAYTDKDTSVQYINLDSSTSWADIDISAFGEMYRTAVSTISPSTTGWTELTSNLTLRNGDGITSTGGELIIGTGYAGTYGILSSVTYQYNNTDSSYTQGILINSGTSPITGATSTTSISSSRATGNSTIITSQSLSDGDTVSIGIQASTAGNVNMLYQSVVIWRKSI